MLSGSSDITNCADGVYILHRNTMDFKARAKEFFGWKDDCEQFKFDNLIEVAKGQRTEILRLF